MPGAVSRGESVASLLKLKWDYPQHVTTDQPQRGTTYVKEARKALPREEALRVIAGDDPRPLLVLRECARCNKTDDALLTPGVDNEKIMFLARWFHCVRLPIDVVQEDHPFHELFPSDDSEHLFVTTLDGATKRPLESDTSRTELTNAMLAVLTESYTKDPANLHQQINPLNDQLDALDLQVRDMEKKRNDLMEARVLDKKKLAKAESELAELKKKVAAKVAEIEKLTRLELKKLSKPRTG
jgi:hypothetical protein